MTHIRNLQKKDAGQVALLIGQLTRNIVEPEHLERRLGKLTGQKNSQFLVATEGSRVVGFGGLAWYAIPSKGLIGWVEEVVVDQPMRGRGIGHDLIEFLLVLAKKKKIKQVKLTTTLAAKHLYETSGFVKKDQEYLIKNM